MQGSSQRIWLEQASRGYETQVVDLKDYLAARGFTETAAHAARFGSCEPPAKGHERMRGRLSIPYLTVTGVVALKFRCVSDHDCKERHCPKYMGETGASPRIYNAYLLAEAVNTIAVTEGELDAAILTHMCGVPAIGIPGATQWQPHWSRMLERLHCVVFADGDEPGRKAASAFARKINDTTVVELPDGEDVNSVFLKEGADVLRELMKR